MAKKLDIAIIGCGTAGMAAAAFLARDGHNITLFEKFAQPRPLGSGLMIQPTGLACLARLGLAEKAIRLGARIDHLHGHTIDEKMIFDVSYARIGSHLFGLGIHRGTLFSILFDEIKRLGISLITSCEAVRTDIQANRRVIYNKQGEVLGDYDLVVDASGVHSPLRTALAQVRYNKPYPYGAVWGVCEDPDQAFGGAFLRQRYHGAGVMIGALAIGHRPEDDKKTIAFFWSLPANRYQSWREAGLEPWRERVIEFWPAMAPFVGQFKSVDDLAFAQYTDTILDRWHEERLIFIGDAGHCSSPQLGQGANMALIDALIREKPVNHSSPLLGTLFVNTA